MDRRAAPSPRARAGAGAGPSGPGTPQTPVRAAATRCATPQELVRARFPRPPPPAGAATPGPPPAASRETSRCRACARLAGHGAAAVPQRGGLPQSPSNRRNAGRHGARREGCSGEPQGAPWRRRDNGDQGSSRRAVCPRAAVPRGLRRAGNRGRARSSQLGSGLGEALGPNAWIRTHARPHRLSKPPSPLGQSVFWPPPEHNLTFKSWLLSLPEVELPKFTQLHDGKEPPDHHSGLFRACFGCGGGAHCPCTSLHSPPVAGAEHSHQSIAPQTKTADMNKSETNRQSGS